jgi:hypothetical protein
MQVTGQQTTTRAQPNIVLQPANLKITGTAQQPPTRWFCLRHTRPVQPPIIRMTSDHY